MELTLLGLLSLLLDLTFISGQIAEGTLSSSPDNLQNSTTKFSNVSHLADLNRLYTENVNATYEDQESFQNQEEIHHYSACNETMFMLESNYYCVNMFAFQMINLGQENWCNWEMVLSIYNELTICMENLAALIHCYYPNAVVQEVFMEVHKQYFNLCGTEDVPPDPPARVILVLTLLPVSVIPILVYTVIWKSSVLD